MPIEDIVSGCFRINGLDHNCKRSTYRGNPHWDFAPGSIAVGSYDWQWKEMGGGMLFLDVYIPSGSSILKAYLRFQAERGCIGPNCHSYIRGEDCSFPTAFTTMANYDARPRTSAMVDYSNMPTWNFPLQYNSVDFAPVVQEIIDRPDWVEGCNMVIFWDDHDGRSTPGHQNSRHAQAWRSGCSICPILSVIWEKP
ncbi:hypothetical protein ES703_98793 [subsurface metagenome]